MIKNIFEWIILAWTTLLVLLISGWILIEFYELRIEIIVGVIAFVGAVLGGMITYIGVGLTIKSNHSLEIERIKKEELMYLYPMKREVDKIQEHIYFEFNENHISGEDIIRYLYQELSYENKLYDNAQRSSAAVYNKLNEFKGTVDSYMEEIYYSGYVTNMNDREVHDYFKKKLWTMVEVLKEEISQRNK